MLGGTLLFSFARATETLDAILDIAANASDDLWLTPTLVRLPNGQRMIAAEACYCGPPERGERALASLRLVGKPVAGEIASRPYLEQQRGLDAVSAPGRHYYYKSGFVRRVSRALIDNVVQGFEGAPVCVTAIPFIHTGGAIGRVKPDATACWNRHAQCDLLIQSDWSEPGESAGNIEASRALWQQFEPYTEGFYVNTDTPDDARRLRATYGDNYPRLVELKRRYDPMNLFRLNANIPPGVAPHR